MKFYCSQRDYEIETSGKCPNHGFTLHEEGTVLILDDNPLSIACYLDEYGDDFTL